MRACIVITLVLAACTSGPATTPAPETLRPPVESIELGSIPTDGESTETGARRCGGAIATVRSVQYRAVEGVDPDALSLDIHAPTAASMCPVVLWVHGGSWQVGDKATAATEVKAAHFVGQGYVFVSVNYRLVSEANDVRWPVFGDDVAAATAWVLDNADSIGVDPERVALLGHSAGAHLVSIVTTNPDLLDRVGYERDDVACVVALDSVTHDLTRQPDFEVEIVRAAFGDDLVTLADGSPTIQATEHADDGPVPQFLIVTRGRPVRLASAAGFESALLDVGASASVYDAGPYDHRDVNVRLGEPGESNITPAVTDFLSDCLS